MQDQHIRSLPLLGEEGLRRLSVARVAVFGLGGVGGHAAEALARAGVGHLVLVDGDTVAPSNLNRQLFATASTVGLPKTEAAARRLADAAPDCELTLCPVFFDESRVAEFDFASFDYVVDAIDSVKEKVALIRAAKAHGVPIICAMGAGNKWDPTAFRVADIEKTAVCPLAKAVRLALRREGIRKVKVVYSEETPAKNALKDQQKADGAPAPASLSFVPSAMGLILAAEVARSLALDSPAPAQ